MEDVTVSKRGRKRYRRGERRKKRSCNSGVGEILFPVESVFSVLFCYRLSSRNSTRDATIVLESSIIDPGNSEN
jgi:hypothetical protein